MQPIHVYLKDLSMIESEIGAAARVQPEGDDGLERILEARDLLEKIAHVSEMHVEAIERVFEDVGSGTTAISRGLGKAIGFFAGLADRIRLEHRASRTLRDLLSAAQFAATTYEMTYLVAVAAKETVVAELAAGHLSDWTRIVREVDAQLPGVLVHELERDQIVLDEQTLGQALIRLREARSIAA